MIRRMMVVMYLGLLAAMVAPVAASEVLVVGDVPFEFSAGDTKLAAGRYQIGVTDQNTAILEIKNLNTGKAVMVPYVTRLAARGSDEALLLFDQQEGQKYLSEVFAPPADGFYLQGAKGKHTHTTVKGLKKK
jgi:hypothetical protein